MSPRETIVILIKPNDSYCLNIFAILLNVCICNLSNMDYSQVLKEIS